MKNSPKINNILFLLLFLTPISYANNPPAAAIASAEVLATKAGFEVLEQGGNAFDAAVAVSAALGVVEAFDSGLGGGGFFLLHRASDNKEFFIDARERAPQAAGRKMYLDEKGDLIPKASLDGPLAAGIPGEPAAFDYITTHYGRLSLKQNMAPAIRFAKEGFPVHKRYIARANWRLDAINQSKDATRIYLINGGPPPLGHIIKQPELAKSLEIVATEGAKGYYRGPLAKKIVTGVREAGGIWTLQDLKDYKVIERKPLNGEYKGVKLVLPPLPSAGGVGILTMLNVLSAFDLNVLDGIDKKHLMIETMRRAYRDRANYLGDSDYVSVPLKMLLSKSHVTKLKNSIDSTIATPSIEFNVPVEETPKNTTHFSIIDTEGNMVAGTLSLNYMFGSGFVVPGTGILLNNEMDDFAAKPGSPNFYGLVESKANAIAPGKRPLSSMTPALLISDDKVAVVGSTGGSRIINQILFVVLDFVAGHGPSSWVKLPRIHHQYLPDVAYFETGALSEWEIKGLEAMGHTLKVMDSNFGDMQVVMWDKKRGLMAAASDPRGEGLGSVELVSKSN